MYIRYQHVRNAVLVALPLGVVISCLGTCLACGSGSTESSDPPAPVAQPTADRVKPRRSAQPVAKSAANSDARAIEVANSRAKPNSKRKDAFEGKGWKINLYEETGDNHYDRAKIDKDRDGNNVEKWNWKDGRWEKDGGDLVWRNGKWGPDKGDKPSADDAPAVPKAAAGDVKFANIARKMLDERASGAKAKDVFGGNGPKVNLYDDDGDGKWDRAKLDIDRDGKDDEKWTAKGGTLERKIVSSGKVLVLRDGAWADKD